ncbi:MAG: IPT/TIG domain-containing protein [Planctomycetes bacterium]|nr:IPT/TIG domain-containing protein [Planctomycetota bacterium]MBI3847111.1 IPT/TIG domain-containing protein [Planctomycetota bacterium]
MLQRKWGLAAASLSVALVFASPAALVGFTTLGGSLGIGTSGSGYQRDVRVFNNFTDAAANDNQTPDPNYPGAVGAPLSIWKASTAWNSDVPSAARNFDYEWQGASSALGDTNSNTVSSGVACSGGTLAFTETPIADGWRIRFCTDWTWSDGPGPPGGSGIDIQAVAVHELGHALGMGHAQTTFCQGNCSGQSIMCPVICGVGGHGIAPDDRNGLQSIYGTIPATKPVITSLSGSFNRGQTLVINGSNFGSSVNVKFTAGTTQNTGTIPGVVFNAPTQASGTQVSVTIPAAALDGQVHVWKPGVGLSNGAAIYINPVVPMLVSLSASSGAVRGGDSVDLFGTNFTSIARVTFDGVDAPVTGRIGTTQITVVTPPGATQGQTADVSVVQPTGSSTLANAFTYTPNPIQVEWTGSSQIGQVATIVMYGPAGSRSAVAIGPEGSFTHPGTGFTFCFGRPIRFSRGLNQLRLGANGQASANWTVTGTALEHLSIQGVVEATPNAGDFQQTNCASLQVFP